LYVHEYNNFLSGTNVYQHSGDLVDFPRFVQLFEEYYLSDNVADLGNFINGKLDFNVELTDSSAHQVMHLFFSFALKKLC
jgi:hypothetical protein